MAQRQRGTRNEASERSSAKELPYHASAQCLNSHLTKILQYMNYSEKDGSRFVRAFPEWEVQRKECSKTLRKVVSTLQESKEMLDMGKMIGSSIQIVGDLFSIFGGNSNTDDGRTPERSDLQSFGRNAARVGAVMRMGCNVIEPIMTGAKLDRVQTSLKKDREELESLGQYFKNTLALNDAIAEFGGYHVYGEIQMAVQDTHLKKEALRKLRDQASKLTNIAQNFNGSSWKSLMSSHPSMKRLQLQNPRAYGYAMKIISKKHTRDLIFEIADCFESVKPVLLCTKKILIVIQNLLKVENIFPLLTTLAQPVLVERLSNNSSPNFASAVNIAINIYDVITVSEKFGKNSRLVEKILEVLQNMEADLISLRTEYDRLKKTLNPGRRRI